MNYIHYIFMNKRNIVLTLFLIMFTESCTASDNKTSYQVFWEGFRSAVLSNDTRYLAENSYFPLELKGVDDGLPVVLLNQELFKENLLKVLNQSVVVMDGEDVIIKSTKDIIKSTKLLTTEHLLTKNSFRVDQLLFEFKNNRWYLVRMYLEE